MNQTWLLLIYSVPAEPSRKRAAIWRDLKRAGAIAVRDGVWALPERDDTLALLQAIAGKVTEFDGQATLVEGARIDPARAESIAAEGRASSAHEYCELAEEAERFQAHVLREREHRNVHFHELEELEADLVKLRGWADKILARDHFGADGRVEVQTRLTECEEMLAMFLEESFGGEDASR